MSVPKTNSSRAKRVWKGGVLLPALIASLVALPAPTALATAGPQVSPSAPSATAAQTPHDHPAAAHPGHDHGSAFDGRIPGEPDFKRVGDTTYRFLPEQEIYKITRPGEPPQFRHADPPLPEGELSATGSEGNNGGWVLLPPYELAPICRPGGNRIIINYDGPSPVPAATIRSAVSRMNWRPERAPPRSARALTGVGHCD